MTGPAEELPGDLRIEDLLRELAPRVLAAVTRRFGRFDLAEDAVQEALLAAVTGWAEDGVPPNPAAWLTTVAVRRMTDMLRSEQARRRREQLDATRSLPQSLLDGGSDSISTADQDDTLVILFLCCHPDVQPASQLTLTLRAVGGLTTAEIARALLVPEATVGQRISRAKQRISQSGARFRLPEPEERRQRLDVVMQVLYLIFNEGYTASSGTALQRVELAAEAIRLTRMLREKLPSEPEVGGLLALMLLTHARRRARTGPTGDLIPLAEQDRTRWDRDLIAEGVALLEEVLPRRRPGPYQLQAAVAAVHAEAERFEDTDWAQIVALYDVLVRMSADPMVRLNSAVAVAMHRGPAAGLALLDSLAADPKLADHHRLAAVRAHLLEQSGSLEDARQAYLTAAKLTVSAPEQRYLHSRAARLGMHEQPPAFE
ncbi:RNA polymerase sigma factor [Kribbella sp. VKM Ac-2566]|uniref:RNA polymerase sigma factor n=1 Tax=Kribbella sp. VKM Ac-2566 TaxID=2512218 RepID=UPI0010F2D64B|nr:sigma-70 family RNA polymerase sigma factor [Kribbella sp. VKM Ac-2566]TDW91194.1 RNA polymerase sigma factor (sigma-70 family) [Kribbella sp. VKM Ac-2566]